MCDIAQIRFLADTVWFDMHARFYSCMCSYPSSDFLNASVTNPNHFGAFIWLLGCVYFISIPSVTPALRSAD